MTSHSRAVSGLLIGPHAAARAGRAAQVLDQSHAHAAGDHRLAAAGAEQRLGQRLDLEVLGEVADRPGVQGDHAQFLLLGAREHHDRLIGHLLDDLARGGDAVQLGHHHVHQHDVGPVMPAQLDGLAARVGLRDDHDARAMEDVRDRTTRERIVVRDDRPQRIVLPRGLPTCI